MHKRPEIPFFITGIAFMLLILGIKYAVQSDVTFMSLIMTFIFGGIVGLLAVSQKDSFLKNIVFIAAFIWVIWAALTPIKSVGDNFVVNSTALLAVITFAVIFIERDIFNSINRIRHKPTKFGLGFLGIIFVYYFLSKTGFGQMVMQFMATNWYITLIIVLVWLVILYFIINKSAKRILNLIVKKIGR